MASHFSIPSRLPAPPGTGSTSRPSQPVIRMTPPQPPQPAVTANDGPDFSSFLSNYLKMLAKPASEPTHESPNVGTAELEGTGATDEASINWAEFLSPAYSDSNAEFGGDVSLDTYLTSPLIDEYDEFTSPLMDTPLLDFTSPNMDTSPMLSDLNTPVIQDQDASWDQPLIVDASVDMYKQQTLQVPTPSSTKATASQLDYDGLLKMSPGNTPAIQSFGDQFPSPAMTMDHSFSPSVATTSLPRPHRDVPTGTRRNITPQSLIPEDAPTQSRRYVTPSATSRKEVPSTFSRKRSRPADDEGDELDEPLPPNATEREMIEYKRRQNTLAARKSRRRKLEHMQNLEDSVTRLTREVEQWKTRTEFLEGLCINHGLLGAGGVGLNGAVYPQGV
ncbi:hypothetical protein VNI00_006742 [Paramarasmius palmivorus]|uniref:BZIP domain-containing protein n=1 Tax=Paramarasmius palmivorus TaxID=297713 RepID=A0AAW0D7H4_9AGAR